MKTTAVQSSTLAAIGYDDAGGTLQLEFRSRAVYRYFGVPGPVFDALWAAPSRGSYFARRWKAPTGRACGSANCPLT